MVIGRWDPRGSEWRRIELMTVTTIIFYYYCRWYMHFWGYFFEGFWVFHSVGLLGFAFSFWLGFSDREYFGIGIGIYGCSVSV